MRKILGPIAFCVFTTVLHAQAVLDTAKIEQTVREAVKLMDRNLPQEAIRTWDAAIKLRPDYTPYKYERSICFVMQKQYKEAIAALLPIYEQPELFDRGYQLLGNCYDFLEDTASARKYYRSGLDRWPESGRLHLEMGSAAYTDGDWKGALDWWTKGARAEPAFASNYYQICLTFANTPYKFWALLYGEMFLNIERATQRTSEISSLLYKTWASGIKPGTSDPINLASEELLNEPSELGATVMNFPMAFEYTVATSVVAANVKGPLATISVAQLVDIRMQFAKTWKESGYASKYANDLLAYHVTMLDAGWLTEYLWWLYSYGNVADTKRYYKENEQRYDTFLGWFGEHQLDISRPVCLSYHCK